LISDGKHAEHEFMTKLAGIVLCGGASQRMGRSKAWLDFGGVPLLRRVVNVIASATKQVVVVAGRDQDVPALCGKFDPGAQNAPDVKLVRDIEEFPGPLAGFAAGLAVILEESPVFLTGCDSPFLTRELVERLSEFYLPNHAIVPVVGHTRQPLTAIYPPGIKAFVEIAMASGKRSFQSLLECIPVIEVAESDLQPHLRAFMPLNDPAAYEEAVRTINDASYILGGTP